MSFLFSEKLLCFFFPIFYCHSPCRRDHWILNRSSRERRKKRKMEVDSSASANSGLTVVGLSPLSRALWGNRGGDVELGGDVSARLTWKDLTVSVTHSNGETQKVLEGLTGYAEPGTLTALMGPSGSGKSTLLDALSSRLAANASLSGSILLNGRKAKLSFGTAVSFLFDSHLHSHRLQGNLRDSHCKFAIKGCD